MFSGCNLSWGNKQRCKYRMWSLIFAVVLSKKALAFPSLNEDKQDQYGVCPNGFYRDDVGLACCPCSQCPWHGPVSQHVSRECYGFYMKGLVTDANLLCLSYNRSKCLSYSELLAKPTGTYHTNSPTATQSPISSKPTITSSIEVISTPALRVSTGSENPKNIVPTTPIYSVEGEKPPVQGQILFAVLALLALVLAVLAIFTVFLAWRQRWCSAAKKLTDRCKPGLEPPEDIPMEEFNRPQLDRRSEGIQQQPVDGQAASRNNNPPEDVAALNPARKIRPNGRQGEVARSCPLQKGIDCDEDSKSVEQVFSGKAEQVRDKATPFRSEPDGGAGAHQPQPSSSGSIPSAANICPHMENITCSNVYIAQHISIPLSQPLQVPSSVYYPQNYQPGPSAPSYVPEIPSHPPAELFSESNWKDSVPIARSETPSRDSLPRRPSRPMYNDHPSHVNSQPPHGHGRPNARGPLTRNGGGLQSARPSHEPLGRISQCTDRTFSSESNSLLYPPEEFSSSDEGDDLYSTPCNKR